MVHSLLTAIRNAEEKGIALGHFNISNLEQLKAIAHVAQKLDVPVIIGVSEGERDYLGVQHVKDLVDSYNKEHGTVSPTDEGFWLFLNADHTHSVDGAVKAARAGFDAILFDGGKLSLEEDIIQTKKAVAAVKAIDPTILIEGELGNIGSSSEIRKEIPKGAVILEKDLTTAEDALRFVKETDVNLLAPAVGNIHGMFVPHPSSPDMKGEGYDYPLNIERIAEIKKALRHAQGKSVSLVLHGGSGNTDKEFQAAIKAGISIIHISTELRVAWRKGIEEALKNHPDEVAPYKLAEEELKEMEKVVEKRLKLFNGIA